MRGKDQYDLIGASILCFNKGETLAQNVEARGDILVTDELGIDAQRKLIKTFHALASGQKLRIEIESERPVRDLAFYTRQSPPPPMYCVGTVSYFDQNGMRRETGFCVRMDASGPRWVSAEKRRSAGGNILPTMLNLNGQHAHVDP
jgi:hypothetical protein